MKTMMLIFAGMLFISVVAVQAQERELDPDTTVIPREDTLGQQGQQKDNANLRGMNIISASEIPNELRQTLQAPEYKGWDAPTTVFYRSSAKDLYVVEIFDGTKARTYRFDKKGQRIKDL